MKRALCLLIALSWSLFVQGLRHTILATADHSLEDYSTFLESLTENGFDVTVANVKDEKAKLFEYGERKYDNVILFSTQSKSLGATLSPKAILEFAQAGGNVLFAAGSNLPEGIRELGRQLDLYIGERHSSVVDHFHSVESSDDDSVLLDTVTENPHIISDETRQAGSIVYKGNGHFLGSNHRAQPVLRGHPSTYVYNKKSEDQISEEPWAAGAQLFLVSVFQNDAGERIGFSGSPEMFTNAYLSPSSPSYSAANALFARDLTNWVFQRVAVLHASNMTYGKVGEPYELHNASTYRIKDQMVFSIDIAVLNDGQPQPYVADDVQMELVMLDPYYRVNMVPVASDSKTHQRYEAVFTAPDHYGVFTYKIAYYRRGLNPIDEKATFTIRQFFHNEYPRFLPHAYPYYVSCFAVLGAFLIFCGIWLVQIPKASSKKQK
ncbi:dolichyl-di-phosphooligosaccharide-protein glycotransferase subunit Wbp1 [Schizosaccharomyces osmophilus]|uniref:Dolichyl-diphosphooligosaccharide--protein glycosyltransferase subunit WBP1 n=1 Tax=Schizosaccharomyces osmophilus TaxID=2545709 RepID=A0AAE9WHF7_9SCHI|nr:dolichyl-di-phosphooligosaccharide-protein glycotransferase subunit Wbp1 [Schizosaccharomyces osmophilus]WBW75613.1 dolichyl-di-phosphooligosaccharide-protein glycotransferase subunit Wbp1 [Schizosaccharomyces osmophilus]